MGGVFGGGGGSSTSGVGKKLRRERKKIEEAQAAYNAMAKPFFGLEQARGEFGQSFFPQLADRIANPTLSPLFKLYAKEGLDTLRSTFANTGSPSSGPAQIAGGRYLEGLAAQQLDKGDQMLLNAANFRGILPQTQEPQYLSLATDLAKNEAQVKAAGNAQNSSGFGGLFGNALGTAIGSFGGPFGSWIGGKLGGMLGGGGDWSGATTGGGWDAWDAGGWGG